MAFGSHISCDWSFPTHERLDFASIWPFVSFTFVIVFRACYSRSSP